MNKKQTLKIAKFLVRWGIAVVGIWWVISKMSWHDHVWAFLPGQNMPTKDLTLTDYAADESSGVYHVIIAGKTVALPHDEVINQPDYDKLREFEKKSGAKKYIVGLDLSPDMKQVRRLLVADKPAGPMAMWEPPSEFPYYQITVPHPRVQIGVRRMLREANPRYIFAALAIFPITILITSLRWHELLKPLDIRLKLDAHVRAEHGGNVLQHHHAARLHRRGFAQGLLHPQANAPRHRAVMSVVVDRIIGLLALVILGGTMAALQWHIRQAKEVAIASAAAIALIAVEMVIFFVPFLRRYTGLDFVLKRLPLQKQVSNAIETMHIYARRPILVLAALIVSFPVHMVVITAAQLCGIAFGLHLSTFYYWMAVPVIVLSGAVPISPQGAGVMEYFAIKLLEPQGVTVGQAFALTMSIRLTQILWNLVGGIFVLRGGYHKPSPIEQKQAEEEDEDEFEGETPNARTSDAHFIRMESKHAISTHFLDPSFFPERACLCAERCALHHRRP